MKETLKKISIGLVALPLLAVLALNVMPQQSSAAGEEFDAANVYKAKCAMCHGQKAEKKFDATKADDVLEAVILKGNDTVTPKMPSYEAKGITPEQAKALNVYMKSLKQ